MPSRIIYLPLEPYKSRYTQYTSVEDGVYETCFKALNIAFEVIRPDKELRVIKQGQVLDVMGRTQWAFNQTLDLVQLIVDKKLDPMEDVIYLEDFWHPGFEQIMYAQSSVFGPIPHFHIPVYSFCHAQSLDKYDFTHPWTWWIRTLEKGWMDYQTKVFCAAREMLSAAIDAGFPIIKNSKYKLMPVGHAFNKEAMLRISGVDIVPNKKNIVVYASRWDAEKNPGLFLELIVSVLKERNDIDFAICTGQPRITSNDPALVTALKKVEETYPYNVKVCADLTLRKYYSILRESKVLFNCALQDWISYVALDAAINDCAPLLPQYLTFPDVVERDERLLYKNLDVADAKTKLYNLVDGEPFDLSFVYNKYEHSVARMCKAMGFSVPEIE